MRGFARLPNLIAATRGRTESAGRTDRAKAPAPASRSQTDAVGLAQYALSVPAARKRPRPDRGMSLPVHDSSAEDHLRETFHSKGRFLVRQDQWEVLGRLIRETDINREVTSEGISTASLLAQGARADFVQAARHAFEDGVRPDGAIISALEEAVDDDPGCWGIAVVAAQAHMDIALASLGKRRPTTRPPMDSPVFRHHFKRAGEILDPFCSVEQGSPLLAAARCDLLMGAADATDRVTDDFEDLIDLDPGNPHHMRRFGLALLPRWFGSFEALDDAAHATAERVEDLWGEGGYTWVWFDAVRAVPEAAGRLDVDRYLEGIDDILERRGTQHVVNLMAAHTGLVMDRTAAPEQIAPAARHIRAQINARFAPILRHRLHELHPRHWAEAQLSPFVALPDTETLDEEGGAVARTLIMRALYKELTAGHRIAFTPEGMKVLAPA